ncbi:hypothetical protein SETIT_7G319600v2 [Setaria italica]|uniref:Leucine-rich repeat-containing N-terminal plant-type domain-containing protein n=1 Tax=Setaria italica TaxID=4555 RepID=A0A368S278_SETIT|nr:probable inactive leucine-rich repeat receptor kinase XIAO [Setaria italica]RCV36444.1 hypothetical protein SETIT_7G319600v2 [Setaria italica]
MMAVLPRRRRRRRASGTRRHPASLGGLPLLARLDLSFNNLFGSIPVRLARLPRLVALDVRNNSLTGSVPAELAAKFQAGFQYGNDLCGAGLPALCRCSARTSSTRTGRSPSAPASRRKSRPPIRGHGGRPYAGRGGGGDKGCVDWESN